VFRSFGILKLHSEAAFMGLGLSVWYSEATWVLILLSVKLNGTCCGNGLGKRRELAGCGRLTYKRGTIGEDNGYSERM